MWVWLLKGLQTGGRIGARWFSRIWSAPIKAAGAAGTRVGGIIGAWRGAGSAAAYVTRIWEARTALVFTEIMTLIQVTGATAAGMVGARALWDATFGKALDAFGREGSKIAGYVAFVGIIYLSASIISRRK